MKKPRRRSLSPDKVRVGLSRRALDLIAAECAITKGETGGMLVGYVHEAETALEYEVTHATPPGHDSKLEPRRFTRGSVFSKRRLDYLASKFGVRYLGEWHKHPASDTPQASNTDRATMRTIARKSAYDIRLPILAITNEDGRKLAIYASDYRRVVLIYERDVAAGAAPPIPSEHPSPSTRIAGKPS